MKKLKSENGATLIIALAFMLVCIFIAVVVATASTTASEQVDTTKKQLQAYLTVSSAEEYFADALSGVTMIRSQKYTQSQPSGGAGKSDGSWPPGSSFRPPDGAGESWEAGNAEFSITNANESSKLFNNLLIEAFKTTYPADDDDSGEYKASNISIIVDDENIENVTMDLMLKSEVTPGSDTDEIAKRTIKFTLYANFYLSENTDEDSDADTEYNNYMSLCVEEQVVEDVEEIINDGKIWSGKKQKTKKTSLNFKETNITVKKGKSSVIKASDTQS